MCSPLGSGPADKQPLGRRSWEHARPRPGPGLPSTVTPSVGGGPRTSLGTAGVRPVPLNYLHHRGWLGPWVSQGCNHTPPRRLAWGFASHSVWPGGLRSEVGLFLPECRTGSILFSRVRISSPSHSPPRAPFTHLDIRLVIRSNFLNVGKR